ncbi:MAG: SLC13 family permease [Bacteroidetes bacterium]|uniref:SLC13 family permease n=1 Tax=Phaeocystidibacter marisrubri TaxID=1577780 RepID=A0A6L3ZII4_9FLAO|nr:SLC13 family permease [Phaeocystidibacter marisrubri]KAB2817647.1 SLC13 family permease [Phaeocystidibacter marisrubri]TNE29957.1 MAG: SLC13 family permease [Bacteroidota bacterium]GGH74311.1 potassium transporter TrkA [Phaeocystidibacter marisrubri]
MTETTVHYILLGALLAITVSLFIQRFKPTLVFGWITMLLVVSGIVPVEVLLSSVSNKSILTIFLLIFITSALRKHFNLLGLIDGLFRSIKSPRAFLAGMTSSVALLSSVVNNTPIVALMIPYVYNWSKKRNLSPSKFLMPLSFAATLGGTITVIGTSTNLVLNGLLEANDLQPLAFSDFLYPGLLVTGFGLLYLVIVGYKLLSNRKDVLEDFTHNRREYIVETVLLPQSNKVGKTITEAGLRNLDGIFLVEIYRGNKLISPVTPTESLQANDLLYFAGEVDRIVELLKDDNGLEIAKRDKFEMGDALDVVEVLLPITSDLAGKKVRETNFRERFDAAIVAIHRDGRRLGGKIGDVELEFGDLLLITTGNRFKNIIVGNKHLYTVSVMERIATNGKREKKWIMGAALLGLSAVFAGYLDLFMFLLMFLGVLASFGMFTAQDLRKDINSDLLIILITAVTLGTSLIHTGTAAWISNGLTGLLNGASPFTILTSVFLLTVVLTSFVTNVASVAIVFPIVAALIAQNGVDGTPYFLALAYGASASFLTPVSYQTNLMVYGPGGYKSSDFLRVGAPLTLIYIITILTYLTLRYNIHA